MSKAEIMKEFKFKQQGILLSSLVDETKFILTKRLVIKTELKLKELKEK